MKSSCSSRSSRSSSSLQFLSSFHYCRSTHKNFLKNKSPNSFSSYHSTSETTTTKLQKTQPKKNLTRRSWRRRRWRWWWRRRGTITDGRDAVNKRDSHRAWEIPKKNFLNFRRQETNFPEDLRQRAWVADFSYQRFWKTKTPQNFLSERERWRRQLLRRWGQILVEVCASEMADQNTGLEKLWITTKLALPRFCLLSGCFQQKIKTGDLKRLVDQNKSRFVFCFFLRNFGGKKEEKQKRQTRHIYTIRSWRSPKKTKEDCMKFLFSPSYNFVLFFFSPRISFCFSFFFFWFFFPPNYQNRSKPEKPNYYFKKFRKERPKTHNNDSSIINYYYYYLLVLILIHTTTSFSIVVEYLFLYYLLSYLLKRY